MEEGYTVGELARLAGTSARALRFYEESGLLVPGRDPRNGYRRYGPGDVNRLQEILLLRSLGVAVRDIAPLLSTSGEARQASLSRHLGALRAERSRLDALIATVERTLAAMRGDADMTDEEKFEGLKRELVEKNEGRFGAEARGRHGDAAVDEANRRLLGMSERDYGDWQALDAQIRSALEVAVTAGVDPAGPEGERVCGLHRRWLARTWPRYSAEAHRGLAESYVADERFRAYYDREVPGCAAWLRDAIARHAR